MLTRLKVSGFKNLVDVDLRFGPFTCVAGPNGVGKSNLFDAIRFLSLLADYTFVQAASQIRGGDRDDLRHVFFRAGDHVTDQMSFLVEMIVPHRGIDDFGQEARATSTLLRYELDLAFREGYSPGNKGPIELHKERLSYITEGDASRHLLFDHSAKNWRRSVVKNERSGTDYISTEMRDGRSRVVLHQDGGQGGKPTEFAANRLPRTLLSRSDAAHCPTVLLARREMQSWRLLQLEPAALRRPDPISGQMTRIEGDGAHLAATLHRLAEREQSSTEGWVYGRVASRLSDLLEDVRSLWVDRDEERGLLTLQIRTHGGTQHPASALSDGSLRFLALAILEQDWEDQGLICLEEPENGVHPERVSAMLRLLQDISVDTTEASGSDNPLRQVIINTHSPAVVQQVPEDTLLIAMPLELARGSARTKAATFHALEGTWRQEDPAAPGPLSLAALFSYLRPVTVESLRWLRSEGETRTKSVVEREDLQEVLPLPAAV